MTVVARNATRILLDTSAFINFVEAGALRELAQYLGASAAVTLDVNKELGRLAGGHFPQLQNLERLGWPAGEPLALPPDLLQDAEDLRRLNAEPGAHEDANRGEIATALLAGRLRVPTVMDDRLGKLLCQRRGVDRLSSAQVAAEMVGAGAVDQDSGYAVFDIASPGHVGRVEFDSAVERAKTALG